MRAKYKRGLFVQVPDKKELFKEIRRRVAEQLQLATQQQQDSQRGAFHEENKAEGSKDTRSTEASYLARGLAQRVADLQRSAALLNNFKLRAFSVEDPVAIGALLAVEDDREQLAYYFIAPGEGGLKIVVDATEVKMISARSPLGRALIGRYLDDEVEFESPQGPKNLTIVQIV